jgi:hypothetical protein
VVTVRLATTNDAVVDLEMAGEGMSREDAIAAIEDAGRQGKCVWTITKASAPSAGSKTEAGDTGESYL